MVGQSPICCPPVCLDPGEGPNQKDKMATTAVILVLFHPITRRADVFYLRFSIFSPSNPVMSVLEIAGALCKIFPENKKDLTYQLHDQSLVIRNTYVISVVTEEGEDRVDNITYTISAQSQNTKGQRLYTTPQWDKMLYLATQVLSVSSADDIPTLLSDATRIADHCDYQSLSERKTTTVSMGYLGIPEFARHLTEIQKEKFITEVVDFAREKLGCAETFLIYLRELLRVEHLAPSALFIQQNHCWVWINDGTHNVSLLLEYAPPREPASEANPPVLDSESAPLAHQQLNRASCIP